MCLSFDHRIIDGMMAGQFPGRSRSDSRSGRQVASSCEHAAAPPDGDTSWIRVRVTEGENFKGLEAIVRSGRLHTVCERRGARTSLTVGSKDGDIHDPRRRLHAAAGSVR